MDHLAGLGNSGGYGLPQFGSFNLLVGRTLNRARARAEAECVTRLENERPCLRSPCTISVLSVS